MNLFENPIDLIEGSLINNDFEFAKMAIEILLKNINDKELPDGLKNIDPKILLDNVLNLEKWVNEKIKNSYTDEFLKLKQIIRERYAKDELVEDSHYLLNGMGFRLNEKVDVKFPDGHIENNKTAKSYFQLGWSPNQNYENAVKQHQFTPYIEINFHGCTSRMYLNDENLLVRRSQPL